MRNGIAERARAVMAAVGEPSGDWPAGSDEDCLSSDCAALLEVARELLGEVDRLSEEDGRATAWMRAFTTYYRTHVVPFGQSGLSWRDWAADVEIKEREAEAFATRACAGMDAWLAR